MDQLSTYGEADRPQASPPKESGTVEDTHKDTSVTPDLAQGVIPGASMSVPADPVWSDPCRQDAPSQASKPIPEGSQDSSGMLPPPPPPPPEEPYDPYQQCMGRSKEDLVTQTPRPTSAAPLLDLASLPRFCQSLSVIFPTYEGLVKAPVGPWFDISQPGLCMPLPGHCYTPPPLAWLWPGRGPAIPDINFPSSSSGAPSLCPPTLWVSWARWVCHPLGYAHPSRRPHLEGLCLLGNLWLSLGAI